MNNNTFTYSLQPYKGRATRHICPNCQDPTSFTYYVDAYNQPISPLCGKCDHVNHCGYHLTPHQYFMQNPDCRPSFVPSVLGPYRNWNRTPQKATICTIPADIAAMHNTSSESNLTTFLRKVFPNRVVDHLIKTYRLGATTNGSTIFYQIDTKNQIRSGKIMQYNPQTGHRTKDPNYPGRVTWLHSLLKSQGVLSSQWQLSQCLFGAHLLNLPGNHDKTVCLVESEKTAIICAAFLPDSLWLATGGKNQRFSVILPILRNRVVTVFPDLDAHTDWIHTIKQILPQASIPGTLCDLAAANPGLLPPNADLADWLLLGRNKHHPWQS